MPVTSVDAANAWRMVHAKPKKPINLVKLSPIDNLSSNNSPDPIPTANTPELSLARAIDAEDSAHKKRREIERGGGSIEDYRKANGVYIASRNNRVKAERDFSEWEHSQNVSLYVEEANDMFNRTFGAARGMIDIMPKTLAPRLCNQPQKEIETTLLEWCSRLVETMRGNVWPKEE